MSVFVLDKRKRPLMPCSEKRARLLLSTCRAVVHRLIPFTIRLKERTRQESAVQPTVLKVDPGSQTTGLALARMEATDAGQVHHALHLAELIHRGEEVRERLRKRSCYRRRASGWLAPSLGSRIGNVLTFAKRYQRWVPLSRIEVERVKFDIALLQQPELTGVEYQRGELFGWEIRSYLLEKFGRRCAYCSRSNVPFEIDHQVPRSRGGSNRVSNLVKGNRTAAEWGHPEVESQARAPFQGAAALYTTRYALVEALKALGVPVGTWSGGRTRWNRDRFGLEKAHCLDVLCVGQLAGVRVPAQRTLVITAQGRGRYQRTNVDASGFPRGYYTRTKRIHGYATGDVVLAESWYQCRCVPRGSYQLYNGSRSEHKVSGPKKVCGWKLFELVEVNRKVGYISGRRGSGRFSVNDVVTGKLLVDGVDHRKLVRLARATHGLIVRETLVQ